MPETMNAFSRQFSLFLRNSDPVAIGWGRKKSGAAAVKGAEKQGRDFQLLEDGFLRSVGREDPPLSVVFDDRGMYYDAMAPSSFERLVFQPLEEKQTARIFGLMAQWRKFRVSKYNAERDFAGKLPDRYVLVVDQVAGDLSVEYGLANAESFQIMLKAALDENPHSTVVVKMHPDIYTRKKAGHFDIQTLEQHPRINVVAESCHPVRLIEQAEKVYVVTSQVGFEALIWGKPVRCFGMPFYAGWGLTEDELPAPDRRGVASLEQLAHAALVDYPRYIDPERGARCEVETVMEYIGLQRSMRSRFPSTLYALGFSPWKKPLLKFFFQGSEVQFVSDVESIPAEATVVVWGSAQPDGASKDWNILRVEDGFLRSSGLGSDLVRPLSWVIDDAGVYYDASCSSRLEIILQEEAFGESLLARARGLREQIVSLGIGKYNLIGAQWTRPQHATHVILVPGQVENDASIRFGAPSGSTNLGLLKAVREKNPAAYLVYKPHPDVVAGLRLKGKGEDEVLQWCDEIITSGDVAPLFDQMDEVHTLTSLTGFEALLRGIPVTCYGNPFYAGWGLTTDIHPLQRRTRKLNLDELVAGALILYPTYVSRTTDAFTSPERAVEELVEWRAEGPSRMPLWRRVRRQIVRQWSASGLRRNP
ncbi:hypothetical protein P4C99_16885 [Pontiellaceae bacterium B1224]|nr:hypothetical protein [Pontiellaceae bacterium B1224]